MAVRFTNVSIWGGIVPVKLESQTFLHQELQFNKILNVPLENNTYTSTKLGHESMKSNKRPVKFVASASLFNHCESEQKANTNLT